MCINLSQVRNIMAETCGEEKTMFHKFVYEGMSFLWMERVAYESYIYIDRMALNFQQESENEDICKEVPFGMIV